MRILLGFAPRYVTAHRTGRRFLGTAARASDHGDREVYINKKEIGHFDFERRIDLNRSFPPASVQT